MADTLPLEDATQAVGNFDEAEESGDEAYDLPFSTQHAPSATQIAQSATQSSASHRARAREASASTLRATQTAARGLSINFDDEGGDDDVDNAQSISPVLADEDYGHESNGAQEESTGSAVGVAQERGAGAGAGSASSVGVARNKPALRAQRTIPVDVCITNLGTTDDKQHLSRLATSLGGTVVESFAPASVVGSPSQVLSSRSPAGPALVSDGSQKILVASSLTTSLKCALAVLFADVLATPAWLRECARQGRWTTAQGALPPVSEKLKQWSLAFKEEKTWRVRQQHASSLLSGLTFKIDRSVEAGTRDNLVTLLTRMGGEVARTAPLVLVHKPLERHAGPSSSLSSGASAVSGFVSSDFLLQAAFGVRTPDVRMFLLQPADAIGQGAGAGSHEPESAGSKRKGVNRGTASSEEGVSHKRRRLSGGLGAPSAQQASARSAQRGSSKSTAKTTGTMQRKPKR